MDGMMRLVNFHLGGSLYTVAAVAAAGGLLYMILLLGVCALLTLVVYENLADIAVHRQTGSLARIVSSVLGRGAALVLRVLIVLNALGVVVAYLQTCNDIYTGVAQGNATVEALTVFFFTVVTGCAAVPVLEHVFSDVADWGSLMANVALLVLLGALFWLSPQKDKLPSTPKSLWEIAISFGPSFVFAFSSAEYVLLACGVCDNNGVLLPKVRVHSQVRFIGLGSLLISMCLYTAVGYGGLRAFGSRVQDDILKNFSLEASDHQTMSAIVLGTNAVSLLLSLPVFAETLLLYTRELLHDLLPQASFHVLEQHPLCRWLVNPAHPYIGCAWVVPLAAVIASKAAGLLSIITLMSACTDYAFMFFFPGCAFCASFHVSLRPLRWTLSFAMLLGAPYMAYLSFMKEWNGL